MSPRRSSRARTAQPPPGPPTHTNSSTSITSLTKLERSTRSNNRPPSPKRSSTQRSESVDDNDAARPESQAPRRSRRGNDETNEVAKRVDDEIDEEDLEEEITRCICGQAEYPGPPISIRDPKVVQDPVTDDMGNFFVQCDHCHVWQHGGCMGFTDEEQLPDEYYCELCKPQLHRTIKAPNGTKSSRYLPLHQIRTSRSSSLSSSTDQTAKKDNKAGAVDASTKRRATMNSRVAYDEDEMLRRAIQESKEMGTLGKRLRDDSEDIRPNTKRQRTSSSSGSMSPRGRSRSPGGDPSQSKSTSNSRAHKMRGAAARNHREKEMRDQQKEIAAQQRAEAANKRHARSERRRIDESPVPTPSLSPLKGASQAVQKKDPSPSHRAPPHITRKGGRPTARRGRVGRNQYTRDLVNGEASDMPNRDTPHDGPNGSPLGANGINGESGRSSKAKTHPARTSMNEMKRRVAAILEFVSRMQIERPVTKSNGSGDLGTSSSGNSKEGANTPNGVVLNGGSSASSGSASGASLPGAALVSAVEAGLKRNVVSAGEGDNARIFTEMGSGEMMESLTGDLVHWQSIYGKYGERA